METLPKERSFLALAAGWLLVFLFGVTCLWFVANTRILIRADSAVGAARTVLARFQPEVAPQAQAEILSETGSGSGQIVEVNFKGTKGDVAKVRVKSFLGLGWQMYYYEDLND